MVDDVANTSRKPPTPPHEAQAPDLLQRLHDAHQEVYQRKLEHLDLPR